MQSEGGKTGAFFSPAVAVALLGWVAVVLSSGGTLLWSKGIALGVAGACLLGKPPERAPGLLLRIGAAGLLLWGLTAFLPVLVASPWRESLQEAGASLGSLVTPRPLATLESLLLMAGAIGWVYFCHNWALDTNHRTRALVAVAVLGGLLAAGLIAGALADVRYPLGDPAHVFSYFPNRNQTALTLAVCGIVTFGLLLRALGYRRWGRSGVYTLLLMLDGLAVSLCHSRAAPFLLLLGCVLLGVFHMRSRGCKGLGVALAGGVVIAASVFALAGTVSYQRVEAIVRGQADWVGFRAAIYEDALEMVATHPVFGVGLGNYASVFPFYREASLVPEAVIHPESDWLWVAAEMGLPGLVFLGLAAGGAARAVTRPNGGGLGWERRIAAVALFVFFLHTLVDVSGHRMGTFMLAAILYGIGRARRPETPCRMPQVCWRAMGLLFLLVGGIWVLADALPRMWHTATVEKVALPQMREAVEAGQWEEVEATARRGLARDPLARRVYDYHGRLRLLYAGDNRGAQQDLAVARALARQDAEVAFAHGLLWLPAYPSQAWEAWEQALAVAVEPEHWVTQMSRRGGRSAYIRARLGEHVRADSPLQAAYLLHLPKEHFSAEWAPVLAGNPVLSRFGKPHAHALLTRWLAVEGAGPVLAWMQDYRGLADAQWAAHALALGKAGQYQAAVEQVLAHTTAPDGPELGNGAAMQDLERAYALNPDNLVAFVAYAKALARQQDWQSLRQVTDRTRKLSAEKLPDYINYWEMQAHSAAGDWQSAWHSARRYLLAQPAME